MKQSKEVICLLARCPFSWSRATITRHSATSPPGRPRFTRTFNIGQTGPLDIAGHYCRSIPETRQLIRADSRLCVPLATTVAPTVVRTVVPCSVLGARCSVLGARCSVRGAPVQIMITIGAPNTITLLAWTVALFRRDFGPFYLLPRGCAHAQQALRYCSKSVCSRAFFPTAVPGVPPCICFRFSAYATAPSSR